MNYYACDYETNNSKTECRVWLYGIYDIYHGNFLYGNTIEQFWQTIEELSSHNSITISFHNLKFDGEFLLIYLLKHNYILRKDKGKLNPYEFKTLISDLGTWYMIDAVNRYGKHIKILNTLCMFPFKLSELSTSFGMEVSKGEIDYDYIRPIGYRATDEEIDYIKRDCIIAGTAWKYALDRGDDRMTAGSNALAFFVKQLTQKKMDVYFPHLEEDEDYFVRQSYRGGWVYANPEYKGKDIGKGIIFDVNSLYPSRMYYELMPYGKGTYYQGKYEEDKGHPLYVQHLECSFELRKNKLPTIQLKNTVGFHKTEYCTSSKGEIIELYLTSTDLKLFLEHYKVKDIFYIDGYKYKAAYHIFDEYIDYWMNEKQEAEKEGNKPRRSLAKLKLNSLYGKFAKRPKGRSKYPELEGDCLKLKTGEEEEQGSLYIPVGTFITSYARNYTIRSAQACYKRFLYADTDSLHLKGFAIPKGIEVDKYELGKWKMEGKFLRAKYLGAKCYEEAIITPEDKLLKWLRENPMRYNQVNWRDKTLLDIKCAGLPDDCKEGIGFDDFRINLSVSNKLHPLHVPNGIMLEKIDYKIRPR